MLTFAGESEKGGFYAQYAVVNGENSLALIPGTLLTIAYKPLPPWRLML